MRPKIVQLSTDNGEWDKTAVYTSNPEALVISQDDETYGMHHEVHLSPLMVSELIYVLKAWQLAHTNIPKRTPNGISTPPPILGG